MQLLSQSVSRGITHLKEHLAGRQGEVAMCKKCSKEIAQMMNIHLSNATQQRESH